MIAAAAAGRLSWSNLATLSAVTEIAPDRKGTEVRQRGFGVLRMNQPRVSSFQQGAVLYPLRIVSCSPELET